MREKNVQDLDGNPMPTTKIKIKIKIKTCKIGCETKTETQNPDTYVENSLTIQELNLGPLEC